MRALLLLILIGALTISARSQSSLFVDGFEDGDLTRDPAWSGDTTDFSVVTRDGNQLLQLTSSESGIRYLSSPSSGTVGNWELYAELQFSPSGSNFAYIFLMSDTSDLSDGNPSGYALKIGESGSDDRLRLVRFDNGTEGSTVLSGTTDISTGGGYRIMVTRESGGKWSLFSADRYAGILKSEGPSAIDNTYNATTHFGILLTYTTTRSDKFYFDFEITFPPFTAKLDRVSADTLQIRSNRPFNTTTLDPHDFLISPGNRTPAKINVIDSTAIDLQFNTPLSSDQYHLTLSNFEDLHGNVIDNPIPLAFTIYNEPSAGDVIINEFMYDPSPGGTEYIELKNITGNYLDLSGWSISDATGSDIISDSTFDLAPHSYLVLTDDTTSLQNVFGLLESTFVPGLPSLNNTGDRIVLKNRMGNILDSLAYQPDWGGKHRALERRSTTVSSGIPENWGDSPADAGGTPGKDNSIPPDRSPPGIEEILFGGSTTISLRLSERLAQPGRLDPSHVTLTPHLSVDQIIYRKPDTLTIKLQESLSNATQYRLHLSGISDIFGNELSSWDTTFTHYVISPADSGDIFINEILYDPPDGLTEFVEIVNPTDLSFDLKGWTFHDATGNRRQVTGNSFVLAPAAFVVLVPDQTLRQVDPQLPMIDMGSRFPSLNNSGDEVVLYSASGILLDSLAYHKSWGESEASIERRSLLHSPNFPENWKPSTAALRATPGAPNSIGPDLRAPRLKTIKIDSDTTVILVFNESLNPRSPPRPINFSLNSLTPITVDFLPPDSVFLKTTSLRNNDSNRLTVSGLSDLFDNIIHRQDTSFTYLKTIQASADNLFITEFLSQPEEGGTEYVELYNPTEFSIELHSLTISDSSSDPVSITGKPSAISPDHYCLLIPDSTLLHANPEISAIVMGSRFPTLNNREDAIVIRTVDGILLDSLTYREEWGTPGRPLERRTINKPASFRENWSIPENPAGSPGQPNSVLPDRTPPKLVSHEIITPRHIRLTFSETVDFSGNRRNRRFLFKPAIGIQSVTTDQQRIDLKLKQPLRSGKVYQLTVNNIQDLFGNALESTNRRLQYFKISEAKPGDLVINEFKHITDSESDAEFVELYNNSSKNLRLDGWTIADAANQANITYADIVKPGKYLVLTGDLNFAGAGTKHLYVPQFPNLNNRTDKIIITNEDHLVIDSLTYTEDWLALEGKSLERKDPSAASSDSSNWGISTAETGNTAGKLNSKYFPDVRPPKTVFAEFDSEGTIEIRFNEHITIHPNTSVFISGTSITRSNINRSAGNTVRVSLPSSLRADQVHSLTIHNISDVKGNLASAEETFIAHHIRPGNLVLNEIMFDPLQDPNDELPDQSEYVELYNTTKRYLSVETLALHTGSDEQGTIRYITPVNAVNQWIPPGGLLLFYPDTTGRWIETRVQKFFRLNDHPEVAPLRYAGNSFGLSNKEETLFISHTRGGTIDSVTYRGTWHNSNIIDTKGIALERIDPMGSGNDETNWSSSVEPLGGTPGKPNSIHQPSGAPPSEHGITFSPNPFSPDNDGFEDHLFINYRLDRPDYLLRVRIFDRYGRLVRELTNGRPAGFEGSLIWDGMNNQGHRNRIGIYIVLFEARDPADGHNRSFREVVVLARRFN